MHPIIGITANQHENRYQVAEAYANAVVKAGGTPIILPPIAGLESRFLTICDGFIFTGGNDPRMEHWNIPTHSNAKPVSFERQSFELSLLDALQYREDVPVLGVCLGMQWMSLVAGGRIDQDMSEQLAQIHADGKHSIVGSLGAGIVDSHHHQAIVDAGSLVVVATSKDGVIEAVQDPHRHWYVGVQWHPERTEDVELGQGLFNQLIHASGKECLS